MAGVDSGKVVVALKISRVPEVDVRALKLDQMVLLDEAGRASRLIAIAVGARGMEPVNLLAAYTSSATERSADRQYLFLVAPGTRTFELRVPNMKPVRVTASLDGFGR